MSSTKKVLGIFIFVLLCIGFINPAGAIEPPTFTVDTFSDTVDENPGDGICADANHYCSLRAAIMEANAQPGDDSIALPAGTYTLTLTSTYEDECADGDLDIHPNESTMAFATSGGDRLESCENNSLTIHGAGATVTIIDGGRIDRVFHIHPGDCSSMVTLNDLTIQNGYRDGNYCCDNFAVPAVPGDDDDDDDDDDDCGVTGGGILNEATTTINRCIIRDNETDSGDGEGSGGGITNSRGSLTLDHCAVVNNTTQRAGGGIKNTGRTPGEPISSTTQPAGGDSRTGSIYPLYLNNTTISGNHSNTKTGGVHTGCSAETYFSYCTVANNSTATCDYTVAGGINAQGFVSLENTIVADNVNSGFCGATQPTVDIDDDDDCDDEYGPQDCTGTFNISGYNIIKDPGCYCTFNGGSPIIDDPLLDPLADNGGGTLTHALLAGSPALDGTCEGPENTREVEPLPTSTDQRLVTRPQGDCNDIGAFEAIYDDGDDVDPVIEMLAPNLGDGNGDGTLDALQGDVTSLLGSDGNYVTVELQENGCEQLNNVETFSEASQGDDPNYDYPYGLVAFEIPCEEATVRVYFHGATDLSGSDYRKYGPTTPGDINTAAWYTLPGATFGVADINGTNVPYAEFTLYDNQLGDDTGDEGIIVDQGGPGAPGAIPTLNEWGMIIFTLLIVITGIYYRRKEQS